MKKERFAQLVLAKFGRDLTTEALGQLKMLQQLLLGHDVQAVLRDYASVAQVAFSGLDYPGSSWQAALLGVLVSDNPQELIERVKHRRQEEGFNPGDTVQMRKLRGSECWNASQRRAAGRMRRDIRGRARRVA